LRPVSTNPDLPHISEVLCLLFSCGRGSGRSPRAARGCRVVARAMRRASVALFALLAVVRPDASAFARAVDDEDRLPGWRGESYLSSGATQRLRGALGDVASVADDEDTGGLPAPNTIHVDPSRVITLSSSPRAYVYRGFLRRAECDYIVQNSRERLQKSTVVDNDTGKSVPSNIRTSEGTFFSRAADDVIVDIERRIAEWSGVPEDHGEGIQVLRYAVGEKYDPHMDSFHDAFNAVESKGGQRLATVLMYLNDVEEGGETVFPETTEKPHANDPGWSDCARKGVAAKPRKGDALLFFSLDEETQRVDSKSLHAGCPVIKGEKWSATKWMHVLPVKYGHKATFPEGVCDDEDNTCEEWANAGECEKNPAYMIGNKNEDGFCMRSCGKCPEGTKPYPKATT